uniref:condensin-2 complex subunit G2 n=1 Tax=Myxine glutinosa TaxID=7769 RepID=UPI00358DFE9C
MQRESESSPSIGGDDPSSRDALLQAAHNKNHETLQKMVLCHKSREDVYNLKEVMEELPNKALDSLFLDLQQLAVDSLFVFPLECWRSATENGNEAELNKVNECISKLKTVATILSVAAATVSPKEASGMMETVRMLQALLPLLPKGCKEMQNVVMCLCEVCWVRNIEGRQYIAKNLMETLLQSIMSDGRKATVAEMKRLWNLREILHEFDFSLDENAEMKELLMQYFVSGQALHSTEGRRFFVFILGLNAEMTKIVHLAVKKQLPGFSKNNVEHCADGYFRAWQKASGDHLRVIEDHCLQNLMEHGIFLPRGKLNTKVRQMLTYFHSQKLRCGVDEMLFKLYQPILWRALKVPNGEIRANAALIFSDAFPLLCPSADKQQQDLELQHQFDELFSFLEDPCPMARSAAVLGTCRVVFKYWALIPANVLGEILTKIVTMLSFDCSSAEVRCTVYKSLSFLLENKLSHPVLERLLPEAKLGLHDQSEMVRVAFVELLIQVKATKSAKYWKICPMDHLLVRLGSDTSPVALRLVRLLIDSFFPSGQSEDIWCERSLTLINMNIQAAYSFYKYTQSVVGTSAVVKLLLQQRLCLDACVLKLEEEEENGVINSSEGKENTSDEDAVELSSDSETMAAVLEVIVILWKSIWPAIQKKRKGYYEYLVKTFASSMQGYFRIFKDKRSFTALVMIASFMPYSSVPTFSCGVVSRLRGFSVNENPTCYGPLLECLCGWNHVGHLLDLVTDWLNACCTEQKSEMRGRRVRINAPSQAKPVLALCYMEYVLNSSSSAQVLLSSPMKLEPLLQTLEFIRSTLEPLSSRKLEGFNDSITLRAVALHCRLLAGLHAQHHKEDNRHLESLEVLRQWLEKHMVHVLQEDCEANSLSNPGGLQNTALGMVKEYFVTFTNLVFLGLLDCEVIGKILEFAMLIVRSVWGVHCLPVIASLLAHITEHCACEVAAASPPSGNDATSASDGNSKNSESRPRSSNTDVLQLVPRVFQKLLQLAARLFTGKFKDSATEIMSKLQPAFSEFVNCVLHWRACQQDLCTDIISTVSSAVIADVTCSLKKCITTQSPDLEEKLQKLPPICACLFPIIVKNEWIARVFVRQLQECEKSETLQDLASLLAMLQIMYFLFKAKLHHLDLSSLAETIKNLLEKCECPADSYERVVIVAASNLLSKIGPE